MTVGARNANRGLQYLAECRFSVAYDRFPQRRFFHKLLRRSLFFADAYAAAYAEMLFLGCNRINWTPHIDIITSASRSEEYSAFELQ